MCPPVSRAGAPRRCQCIATLLCLLRFGGAPDVCPPMSRAGSSVRQEPSFCGAIKARSATGTKRLRRHQGAPCLALGTMICFRLASCVLGRPKARPLHQASLQFLATRKPLRAHHTGLPLQNGNLCARAVNTFLPRCTLRPLPPRRLLHGTVRPGVSGGGRGGSII